MKILNDKGQKLDYYCCKKCNEVWEIVEEDYPDKSFYPTICPLCSMPIWQMVKEVYECEGITEVLKRLWMRITR